VVKGSRDPSMTGVTINHTGAHRTAPAHTGPEMTDYFALTPVSE